MNTKMGVFIYMYLKHPPDYIDSNYILVHETNFPGSSVCANVPFLAFLMLDSKGKRCGQVEHSPHYSQSEVVCAYQVLEL